MPELHPLYRDHAVISSTRPVIQGKAAPGAEVEVEIAGASARATAAVDGKWRAHLPDLPAGGPHTLIARDASGEARATDVMIGRVWLGSGQSNMEWTLGQIQDGGEVIAAADEPRLRFFTVEKISDPHGPREEARARWIVCSPLEAINFSAIGYHFARRMIAETGTPFGMIISAWGGSAIAPWLPEEVLRSRPEYVPFIEALEQARESHGTPQENKPHTDPGIAAHATSWAAADSDDRQWSLLPVPGTWQSTGWNFNGAVWYRRSVEIPEAWLGRDLELTLGIVDDFDHTYVNGTLIGAIGAETPSWWTTNRVYTIPAHLVTQPLLQIAVRVFDIWGEGGMVGHPQLRPADETNAEPLKLGGLWRAHPELKLPPRSAGGQNLAPSALWNSMIHPLLGASLDGVLWYQGESDTTRAHLYQRLLSDLINAWRDAFNAPALPFGIVQLANYMERKTDPVEDSWAELREAQRRVALHVPACGLALAIDVGEADDIHPRDKKTVGERLAAWALHQAHARHDLVYSGPLPAEVWPDRDGLRVRFVHATGLRSRTGALPGFELADANGQWHYAQTARIEGDTVFAATALAPQPTAIRYAWQANPEVTLENTAGLPASPFRLQQN